jgi:hypothetical protein
VSPAHVIHVAAHVGPCGLQEYAEFTQMISDKLPEGWEKALPTYTPEDKPLATRLHSQTNLNALASVIPGTSLRTPTPPRVPASGAPLLRTPRGALSPPLPRGWSCASLGCFIFPY